MAPKKALSLPSPSERDFETYYRGSTASFMAKLEAKGLVQNVAGNLASAFPSFSPRHERWLATFGKQSFWMDKQEGALFTRRGIHVRSMDGSCAHALYSDIASVDDDFNVKLKDGSALKIVGLRWLSDQKPLVKLLNALRSAEEYRLWAEEREAKYAVDHPGFGAVMFRILYTAIGFVVIPGLGAYFGWELAKKREAARARAAFRAGGGSRTAIAKRKRFAVGVVLGFLCVMGIVGAFVEPQPELHPATAVVGTLLMFGLPSFLLIRSGMRKG